MTVRVGGAHLGSTHAVRAVVQCVDIGRFNGLGEAGPPASRFKLVGRSEQRLTRYDVDVDPRFLVFQVFAGSWSFSAALLCYAILLRRQLVDRLFVLPERAHRWSSLAPPSRQSGVAGSIRQGVGYRKKSSA